MIYERNETVNKQYRAACSDWKLSLLLRFCQGFFSDSFSGSTTSVIPIRFDATSAR